MRSNKVPFIILIVSALYAIYSSWFLFTKTNTNKSPPLNWPVQYEGSLLQELPLTELEERFQKDFPGGIKRFSDGQREIIMRKVHTATRKLHPASDCFKSSGYKLQPLPLTRNSQGTDMACFEAKRKDQLLKVCEYIEDGDGNSWTDVSSWYWRAFFSSDKTLWTSYVIAQRIPQKH